MGWAELTIPDPPKTDDVQLNVWLTQIATHLRNYLGSFESIGDPSAVHFDVNDFTTNGNWQDDFDLSSIVPADARVARIKVYLVDDAANSYFQFRENGNSNSIATYTVRIMEDASVANDGYFDVPLDSNRYISYRATNTTFATIDVTILGWYR